MRRLLFAVPFLIAVPAFAQTQAANPVEVFANGKRSGVTSQPFVVLTVSQALPLASLPATCSDGALALVTDGRTPMQAAGAGTGVVARCLTNKWLSVASSAQVQN
ncbi:hypothetical protein AA103196_3096 [Ameyamaea chiangmaiensis NBRC 103196]|uniref:Uncharacterized protein n=1 Tax=Ameyamaea chiangmaiensis TaxID=442969 RepID=A0A850P3V5_9PROT|nr:hypothetical protein [Ameyamaea chiangmaiensis]MBS4074581.1 hypothetical protein [Ameyamaea chiangmaiensis]NVN39337.1 hypothetical protein [Ameyamaea chiangmaiensis]GBQ72560.1 hypothetical protein AA103196_3096 [Ameyamaea chiangmaiensis NBRC 103196]